MRLRWILFALVIIALAAGYAYKRRSQPVSRQAVVQEESFSFEAAEPSGDAADQPVADAEELNPESAEADVFE